MPKLEQKRTVRFNLQALEGWEFKKVKDYLRKEGTFSEDEIASAEKEYRHFIELTLTCPGQVIVPSTEVDRFWHAHILFTRDYYAFCQAVAGTLIHHNPLTSQAERDSLRIPYEETTNLVSSRFVDSDSNLWRPDKQECHADY